MLRHSLSALVLAILAASVGSAGGKLDPVKVEAKAAKSAGDMQVVLIEMKIDKGWHIYANPTDNNEVADAETIVRVKVAGKAVAATVKYPAGKVHKDKLVGNYKVYEDKVVIPVEFAKTSSEVQVSVRFQACDNSKCLQAKTVTLNVK